jgi:hypothetical protein
MRFQFFYKKRGFKLESVGRGRTLNKFATVAIILAIRFSPVYNYNA